MALVDPFRYTAQFQPGSVQFPASFGPPNIASMLQTSIGGLADPFVEAMKRAQLTAEADRMRQLAKLQTEYEQQAGSTTSTSTPRPAAGVPTPAGGMTTAGSPAGDDPGGAHASGTTTVGSGMLAAAERAMQSVESGGSKNPFTAVGPVTKNGDRAYGYTQVMGANVGPWTEKYFGQRLTPEEFLANPAAQQAVFRGEFGGYLEQYGNIRDAASKWFTGRPYAQAARAGASDGYNTVDQYVGKVQAALRTAGPPPPAPGGSQASFAPPVAPAPTPEGRAAVTAPTAAGGAPNLPPAYAQAAQAANAPQFAALNRGDLAGSAAIAGQRDQAMRGALGGPPPPAAAGPPGAQQAGVPQTPGVRTASLDPQHGITPAPPPTPLPPVDIGELVPSIGGLPPIKAPGGPTPVAVSRVGPDGAPIGGPGASNNMDFGLGDPGFGAPMPTPALSPTPMVTPPIAARPPTPAVEPPSPPVPPQAGTAGGMPPANPAVPPPVRVAQAQGLPPAIAGGKRGLSRKEELLLLDLARTPEEIQAATALVLKSRQAGEAGKFSFHKGDDGTIYRLNEQTGELKPAGGGTSQEWEDVSFDPKTGVSIQRNKRTNEIQIRGKPTTQIDLGQKSEAKEEEKLGEQRAKAQEQMREGAGKAQSRLDSIGRVKGLLANVETGKLTPAKTTLALWGRGLGISDDALKAIGLDPKQAADTQAVEALVGKFISDSLASGEFPTNNFSNADAAMLKSQQPGIGKDPAANRLLLGAMEVAAERQKQKQVAWRKWQAEQRKVGTARPDVFDFEDEWQASLPTLFAKPGAPAAAPVRREVAPGVFYEGR